MGIRVMIFHQKGALGDWKGLKEGARNQYKKRVLTAIFTVIVRYRAVSNGGVPKSRLKLRRTILKFC